MYNVKTCSTNKRCVTWLRRWYSWQHACHVSVRTRVLSLESTFKTERKKSQVCACNPSTEERWISVAHWPASLAYLLSQKKKKCRLTSGLPMHLHMNVYLHTQGYTRAYLHIYKHKEGQKGYFLLAQNIHKSIVRRKVIHHTIYSIQKVVISRCCIR